MNIRNLIHSLQLDEVNQTWPPDMIPGHIQRILVDQEMVQNVHEMSRRSRKCVMGLWTFVWRSMKCVNRYRKWLQSSGIVWAKLSIFPDNYGNFNPCLHMFPGGIFWGGKVFPDVIFSINRIRNSWPYAIWINLLGFIDPQNQVFWYIHQNTALCWNSHPYKTLKWMYVKTRLTRHF